MNRDSLLGVMNDGWKRSMLLMVAFFAVTVSAAHAERPRIAAAGLCGVVTDLTGEPVEKATVTAMFGDSSTSEETDKAGKLELRARSWAALGAGRGSRYANVRV